MSDDSPDIVIVRERIDSDLLRSLAKRHFVDMVKYVVDVERQVIAVGGGLHADAEAVLLEDGSRQQDLWGANYYPTRDESSCIEFTSLINIRPAQDNRSMELQDASLREKVRVLTHHLLGRGLES